MASDERRLQERPWAIRPSRRSVTLLFFLLHTLKGKLPLLGNCQHSRDVFLKVFHRHCRLPHGHMRLLNWRVATLSLSDRTPSRSCSLVSSLISAMVRDLATQCPW